MDETKLTANLPNLDIEIVRRVADDGGAETLTMTLRATPDLDSAARLFLPQAMLMPLLAANPFLQAWARMMAQAWSPWAALPPPPDRQR